MKRAPVRQYPHHTAVYLDTPTNTRIRRLNRRTRVPVAEIIRLALGAYLDAIEQAAEPIATARKAP